MKKLLFILFILNSIVCYSQSNEQNIRSAFTLQLAVDNDNFYTAQMPESNYINPDNSLQIYPGEILYIEIEHKGKKIITLKRVAENLNPEKTVIINFAQKVEGKQHKLMMLTIFNPFEYELHYTTYMFLMKYNKWVPTNVIPVKPKLKSIETWSDLITTLALNNFQFK